MVEQVDGMQWQLATYSPYEEDGAKYCGTHYAGGGLQKQRGKSGQSQQALAMRELHSMAPVWCAGAGRQRPVRIEIARLVYTCGAKGGNFMLRVRPA
ncbi:hypothetical protein ABV523_11565 [Snodgrassella alvi]|uniref:hypothetical protein n=1 Tax=Snodgrassella alvi TaxID=1196083 RepID=UPI0034E8F6BD